MTSLTDKNLLSSSLALNYPRHKQSDARIHHHCNTGQHITFSFVSTTGGTSIRPSIRRVSFTSTFDDIYKGKSITEHNMLLWFYYGHKGLVLSIHIKFESHSWSQSFPILEINKVTVVIFCRWDTLLSARVDNGSPAIFGFVVVFTCKRVKI